MQKEVHCFPSMRPVLNRKLTIRTDQRRLDIMPEEFGIKLLQQNMIYKFSCRAPNFLEVQNLNNMWMRKSSKLAS